MENSFDIPPAQKGKPPAGRQRGKKHQLFEGFLAAAEGG